jgi:hypothetical protein
MQLSAVSDQQSYKILFLMPFAGSQKLMAESSSQKKLILDERL